MALATIAALMAVSHSAKADEYPSMALRLAPQFYYLWTDEECLTAERAVTNPHALPWTGLLSGDKFKQQTQQAIIDKCHAPGFVWDTERGPDLRHHVHLYLNEQVLVGLALSRYICRQTHGLHAAFKGNPSMDGQFDQAVTINESGVLVDRWGEDYSIDENENLVVVTPDRCDYLNASSRGLFKKVESLNMRSDGGVTWPHVWQKIEWAMTAVKNWNKQ